MRSSCQKPHWIHRGIQRPRVCSHPLLEDGPLTLLRPGFFPWFISSSLAVLSSSLQNTPSAPPLWWPYFDLAVALPFFFKDVFYFNFECNAHRSQRSSHISSLELELEILSHPVWVLGNHKNRMCDLRP